MCSLSHLELEAHQNIKNPTIITLTVIINTLGLKSAMLFVAFCLFWVFVCFLFLTSLIEQVLKSHIDLSIMFLSMSLCVVLSWLL